MQRGYKVYMDDIIVSIKNIEEYTKGMSYKEFAANKLVCDAVIRNLEIVGEAVKNISSEIKAINKDIEWRKIAGLRDMLAHEYFGVDLKIVWDVVTNKLIRELK